MNYRKFLDSFEAYSWELSNKEISTSTGIDINKIKRFDTNTSPYNPEYVLDKLKGELNNLIVNQYPDTSYLDIREKLVKYTSLKKENMVITCGADECLDIISKTFISDKDKAIISTPTYSYFRIVTEIMGGQIINIDRKNDFSDDIEKIIKTTLEENVKIIFLCNPNNPTGNNVEKNDVIKLLNKVNCTVVVDEAYDEFAKNTFSKLIDKYKNLIIVRTFSKAFSLAGGRVGYILANENTINLLNKIRPPNSLSKISLFLAESILENLKIVEKWINEIITEKNRCEEILKRNNIRTYKTNTNFILMEFEKNKSQNIHKKLLNKGLVLRDLSSIERLKNCLRFTIGLKDDNNQVIEEIVKLNNY